MGLGLSRTINKLSDLPRNKQASLYTRNRSFVPSGPGRNRYGQKESTFFTVPVENDDYRRDVSICIKTAKQRLATRSKSRGDTRITSKFIIAHTKEEQLEAQQQAQREAQQQAQQQARQEAQEKRLALLAQLTASNRVLGPSSIQRGSVQEARAPFSRPKRPDMGPMPEEGEEGEGEEEISGRYRQPPPPLQRQDTLVPVPEIQQQQQQQGQPQPQPQQQQGQTQSSQLREPVGAAPTKVRGLLGNIFNKPSTGGGQRRKTVSRRPVRASKRKNRK